MLVAAREVFGQLFQVREFDGETLHIAGEGGAFSPGLHEPPTGELKHVGQAEILARRAVQNEALGFAVLGQQADAGAHCVARVLDLQRAAIQFEAARVRPVRAEYEPRGFGAAGADQAGQTEDFTAANRKRNVTDFSSPAEVFRHEAIRADNAAARRKFLIQRPAHHHLDQVRAVDLADCPRGRQLAIAQDHHTVGDGKDLFQPVADVNDPEAVGLQVADDGEEPLHFRRGQRGGRLIHHDNPGP